MPTRIPHWSTGSGHVSNTLSSVARCRQLILVDQIEKYPLNFQGWDSNQIIRGKGAISGTFLLCVNRFGSFTSELQATSTTMCHSLYKSPLKCAYCSIFQAVSSFICQSGLSNISRPVPKFLSQFVYDVLKIQKYLVKFALIPIKGAKKYPRIPLICKQSHWYLTLIIHKCLVSS